MTEHLNFSVIIPTRDRAGPLAACLRAVAQLNYAGGDFEVIVVNDGSGPPDVDAAPDKDFPPRLRWIHLPNNEGPAAARNCGATHARGRYLVFLDDDCQPAPDWLTQLRAALESAPGSAVGGRLVDGRPEDLCTAANQTILDFVYNYYNPDWRHARFLSTANLAVPADLYRCAGGFDQDYRTSEDREFCARWLASGLGLVYAHEAVVVHCAETGLGRFWRRHYHFGKGAYQFRSRHSKTPAGRIRMEPPAFYRRLLWAPFSQGFSLRAVQLSLLVGLSQLASALGFLSACCKRYDSNGRKA